MDLSVDELGCAGAESVGCAGGYLYWQANALIVMRKKKTYLVLFSKLCLTDVHQRTV